MKKFLLLGLFFVCGVCFGQDKYYLESQDFFKRGLNVILQNNNTKEKKYNCYFKNNDLFVVCETFIGVPYADIMERSVEAKDLSTELAYRTTEILKSVISSDHEKIYNSNYIFVKHVILTADYKNINYDYLFKASDLYKIAPYFNKNDFLNILK